MNSVQKLFFFLQIKKIIRFKLIELKSIEKRTILNFNEAKRFVSKNKVGKEWESVHF